MTRVGCKDDWAVSRLSGGSHACGQNGSATGVEPCVKLLLGLLPGQILWPAWALLHGLLLGSALQPLGPELGSKLNGP